MNLFQTFMRGTIAIMIVFGIAALSNLAIEYDKKQTAQNFSCEKSAIKKDFVIKVIEAQNNSNMLHVPAGEEADMIIEQHEASFTSEGGITPIVGAGVSVLVNFISEQGKLALTTYSFYDKNDYICVTVSVAQPD